MHAHAYKSKHYLHISKNYCTFAVGFEKKCASAVRFWWLNRITYREPLQIVANGT